MNYYVSTRDSKEYISDKEAIIKGFAEDGGLYVMPNLKKTKIDLVDILKKDYAGMAFTILNKLLPSFDKKLLKKIVHKAYNNNFDDKKITPIRNVDDFHILELFHGPTSAFKDIGLQILPLLMKACLTNKQKMMILTATSGDTGSAALNGFKGNKNVGISVFYPNGGVSKIQKQQMMTNFDKNTRLAAIKGNFDDAQSNVKAILNDKRLKHALGQNHNLSSANSINIGRLMPQIIYYFNAYKQLVEQNKIHINDKVSFTVPTGNFGDVLAGYYAKLLGLPINKLVIACNSNKVLKDFFDYGIYDRNRPFIKTVAPSMDIQISSNFERLLYYISNENTQYVKKLMKELKETGKYKVTESILKSIKQDFSCGYSNDDEIKESIKKVYDKYNYLMDPHTASGYKVMREEQRKSPNIPMILLSTANPYKFEEVVADAISGHHYDEPKANTNMINRVTKVPVPKQIQSLWEQKNIKPDNIKIDEMHEFVKKSVKEVFAHD